MIAVLARKLTSFRGDRSGGAMVEFAIALPLLLLVMGLIIEGARITWIHQAAASGVRDAARYLARSEVPNICDVNANVTAFNADTGIQTTAETIVTRRTGNPDENILPGLVTVLGVTPAIDCVDVTYQTADIAVVEVTVRLQIDFPFAGAFSFFGTRLEPLITEVSDESRVFGT